MTEQCEHEWRRYIDHERYYALFICDKPDCNAELSMQEAEIVLNKHAALKRENERLFLACPKCGYVKVNVWDRNALLEEQDDD